MAVLVEGYAEHIRVMPEDLLGSVSVVHVGINDCDLLVSIFGPQVLDHDGHVVDVAETPVAVNHSHAVVARRPDQCKAVSDLALLKGIGQGNVWEEFLRLGLRLCRPAATRPA